MAADTPLPRGAPTPDDRRRLAAKRMTARAVDLALAGVLVLLYWLHVPGGALWLIAAALYLTFGDALLRSGSAGKRLVGLQVVQLRRRRHASWRGSAIRNGPGAVLLLLLLIHGALGIVLFAVVGGLVLALEGYLVIREGDGIRVGDIFADTAVIPDDVPLSEVMDSEELPAYETPEEPER